MSHESSTSTYTPTNGSVVTSSSLFKTAAQSSATSGYITFPNSGSTQCKDCYYALHKVSYTKSSSGSRTLTIRDYYDFESGDLNYGGIEGIAVNAMYNAQQGGYIVPFNVKITATYIPPNYQEYNFFK